MTIPHVPSNPDRIAYASEQNALIDQSNTTTVQTDEQQTTLDGHGSRITALEAAPPEHTHPIAEVTDLQTTLTGHDDRITTLEQEPEPSTTLDGLSDVSAAGAVDGNVLKYDGTAAAWVLGNDLTGSGGSGTLDGLSDVSAPSPATGDVLVFNGTSWVSTAAPVQAAAYRGTWTDANNGAGTTITNGVGGGGAGVKITDIGVAIGSPTGCSMSAGTFTPAVAGRWAFSVSTQYQGGNTNIRAVYLAQSSAASAPAGVQYGLLGGPTMDAQATGCEVTLAAGDPVSVYVAVWTAGGSVTIHRSQGNLLSATWLGP